MERGATTEYVFLTAVVTLLSVGFQDGSRQLQDRAELPLGACQAAGAA